MPSQHQPWSMQDAPGWASQQTDVPLTWAVGPGLHSGSEALWSQLYTEEPPPELRGLQVAREEAETNRGSDLTPELDIKPGGERKYDNKHSCEYVHLYSILTSCCVCCTQFDCPVVTQRAARVAETPAGWLEKRGRRGRREEDHRSSPQRENVTALQSKYTEHSQHISIFMGCTLSRIIPKEKMLTSDILTHR